MESLDWTKLAGDITPETGRIPYEENKHLFRKVAFDVFQLNSSPVESLWTLEDGENGDQFLVAQYSEEEEPENLESKGNWEALSDSNGKNVTLMYKGAPIQRFASVDYGFDAKDVHIFQQTLVEKLGSDESFTSKFLKSQPKVKFDLLVSKFPELRALAAREIKPEDDPEEESDSEFTIEDPGAQHDSGGEGTIKDDSGLDVYESGFFVRPDSPEQKGTLQDEDRWDIDVNEKRTDDYPELKLSEPIEKQVALLLKLQHEFPEELSELVNKLK